MGYDQLNIGILLLDFQQLDIIHRVCQALGTGNMDLHYPAVLVCQSQMLVGQEVIDTDLVAGDIAGCKLQVYLQALEAGITEHRTLHRFRALAGVGDIQGGEIVPIGALGHISVVLLQINGDHRLAVQHGDDLILREQQAVCFIQIFHRIIVGYHIGPGAAAVGIILAEVVLLIQPDMGMAVDKCLGQKILQVFFIKPAVIGFYIQKAHRIVPSIFILYSIIRIHGPDRPYPPTGHQLQKWGGYSYL